MKYLKTAIGRAHSKRGKMYFEDESARLGQPDEVEGDGEGTSLN